MPPTTASPNLHFGSGCSASYFANGPPLTVTLVSPEAGPIDGEILSSRMLELEGFRNSSPTEASSWCSSGAAGGAVGISYGFPSAAGGGAAGSSFLPASGA